MDNKLKIQQLRMWQEQFDVLNRESRELNDKLTIIGQKLQFLYDSYFELFKTLDRTCIPLDLHASPIFVNVEEILDEINDD